MLYVYNGSYCIIIFNSFNNKNKTKHQFNVIRSIVFELTICILPTVIIKLYVLLELFPFKKEKESTFM